MRIGHKPVTASAGKVTVTGDSNRKLKETPEEERLWDAYDRLPELHYGVSIRSNIANRFDYFPARRSTPVAEPDRIGEVEEGETVPAADKAVVDVFENEGGADLIRRLVTGLVVHWDVTGLAYVVATGDKNSRDWEVLSSQELKKRADADVYDRLDSSGNPIKGQTLRKDEVFLVWRPHPRNSRKPDSPLRSSLEIAEQLILLNREMRARSLSRIGAGILWISDGMDFTDPNGDPIDEASFEQMLMDRLTRPIKDAGSAGSVAPWVLKAAKEDIEAARHQTFARDWEVSRDDREELIRRLANGMDLPPEILLGVADVNHWTAWQVQESAVSQHVDPTVRTILDSLTTGWFIPILLATPGITDAMVAGVVLWRDITPAVVPADNNDQHFQAHDAGAIGYQALRERLGYDEEEAPSVEDLALLLRLKGGGMTTPADDPLPESQDDRDDGAASAVVETFQAAELDMARTVTARTVDLADLADLDAATLNYVLTEAESALDRLVEKAAARARSQMQSKPELKQLRNLPNDVMLQEGIEAGLFQTTELIKDDDLTPVIARLRRRLMRAQDQARDTLARLVEAEPAARSLEEDADLDSGLSLLSLILLAAAARALTTPGGEPDPVDVGEVRDFRLPVTEIRDALSTVGGGVPEYDNIISWELIGNGRRTQQKLSDMGASSLKFEWLYGDPSSRVTNFDPHRRLNGVTFTEWEDEQLTVTSDGAWTGVSHYRPGDHRGCLCQYRRTVSLPIAASAATV